MQSVAGMLEQYYTSTGTQKTFMPLPIIDPTIFDDNTNILHVLLGILFQEFQKKIKQPECFRTENYEKNFESQKQDLLGAFQQVRDCVRIISAPEDVKFEGNDIAQLADMASVSQLHQKMDDLIKKYLKLFQKDTLILKIDDIDLQTKYAYQMIEEVRKYFVLPDVIILMSFKLEQLQKVIELENTKNYELLLLYKQILPSDIQEIAARYILKLIPINHRIFMPTLDVYADSLIEYLPDHKKESKTLIGNGFSISVKYAITSLIYKKCRYLFYHSKGVVSPIVPTNLRELRHLLAMLVEMDDYYSGLPNEKITQKTNKIQFLNYFYKIWVTGNISSSDYDIVKSLIAVRDASTINKTVLQHLNKRFGDILSRAFVEILNPKNATYNISIADVYSILDFVKNRISNISDKNIIFFIETYYSIKMYEYYDELTAFDFDKKIASAFVIDKDDYSYGSIKKNEMLDGVGNYEILVGGNLIETNIYPFIAKDRQYCWSDGKYRLYYGKLKDEAWKVIKDKNPQKLQMIEFLALCISKVWRSNATYNKDYRAYNELYYNFTSETKTEYVVFDLGSFFSNIINVKRAYGRLHPEFYEFACEQEDSLYNLLLKKTFEIRDGWCTEERHALLSCAAIRNYEVLSDFIYSVLHTSISGSEGNLYDNIGAFLKKLACYEIKTYDRNMRKAGSPGAISFNYAKDIEHLFSAVKTEQREFFNGMFKEPEEKQDAKVFEEFDIDGIMELFTLQSYAKDTIRKKIQACCAPIIAKDGDVNTQLNKMLREMQGDENGRLNLDSVRAILIALKQGYEHPVKTNPLF